MVMITRPLSNRTMILHRFCLKNEPGSSSVQTSNIEPSIKSFKIGRLYPTISQISWNNRETTRSLRWQGRKNTDAPSSPISIMNSLPSERQLQMSITFHQISTNNQTKQFFQFVHINYPHMSSLPVIVILPKETPPYCPRSGSSLFQIGNILQDFMSYMFPSLRKTSTSISRNFGFNSPM